MLIERITGVYLPYRFRGRAGWDITYQEQSKTTFAIRQKSERSKRGNIRFRLISVLIARGQGQTRHIILSVLCPKNLCGLTSLDRIRSPGFTIPKIGVLLGVKAVTNVRD